MHLLRFMISEVRLFCLRLRTGKAYLGLKIEREFKVQLRDTEST